MTKIFPGDTRTGTGGGTNVYQRRQVGRHDSSLHNKVGGDHRQNHGGSSSIEGKLNLEIRDSGADVQCEVQLTGTRWKNEHIGGPKVRSSCRGTAHVQSHSQVVKRGHRACKAQQKLVHVRQKKSKVKWKKAREKTVLEEFVTKSAVVVQDNVAGPRDCPGMQVGFMVKNTGGGGGLTTKRAMRLAKLRTVKQRPQGGVKPIDPVPDSANVKVTGFCQSQIHISLQGKNKHTNRGISSSDRKRARVLTRKDDNWGAGNGSAGIVGSRLDRNRSAAMSLFQK